MTDPQHLGQVDSAASIRWSCGSGASRRGPACVRVCVRPRRLPAPAYRRAPTPLRTRSSFPVPAPAALSGWALPWRKERFLLPGRASLCSDQHLESGVTKGTGGWEGHRELKLRSSRKTGRRDSTENSARKHLSRLCPMDISFLFIAKVGIY